ncbi:MAG: hypothetical protein ACXVA9_11440 [Bdellovibrionales bacterium]
MKTKFILLSLIAFMISPAHALIDVRLGYGQNLGDPKQLNAEMDHYVSGASAVKSMVGLNADVLVMLPLVPIGFGLRYESLSDSKSSGYLGGSLDSKIKFDRLALLLNYRIIDTIAYFGPIATYGLMNTAKFSNDCNGCSATIHTDGKAGSASSYSLGVEGGLKLPLFRVGAELGYASFIGKDYDSNGTVYQDYTGSNLKIDLTGVYCKILLGVGF